MKLFFLIPALLLTFLSAAQKTKNSAVVKKEDTKKTKRLDEYEMKQYFIVFLKSGPNRTQDSATAAKIQEGHLAHLTKMYNEGKMDMAGPFGDDSGIRGICVYNVATLEEVKQLAEMDPAVKSGRLVVEIHPWYAAKGSSLK